MVVGELKYYFECFICFMCGIFIGDGDIYMLVEYFKLYCGYCYYQIVVIFVIEQILFDFFGFYLFYIVILVFILVLFYGKCGFLVFIDFLYGLLGCGIEYLYIVCVQGVDLGCMSLDVKNFIYVGDWILEINGMFI